MQLQELLSFFEGVRKAGGQYLARCPAHDDLKQSLAIRQNGKGIGIYCHAGCVNETILPLVGLTFEDLFFDPLPEQQDEVVAEYDYTDADGKLLYQVVRYEPKAFKQRRMTPFGWAWNMKGAVRVPYMLHEILSRPDEPVFVVEGEKDVHTLRVHGLLATTNAGGAGKWQEEWNEYFVGRRVILVPDMDEPGQQHVNKVGTYLKDVATVYYIQLWGAKDATEWFIKNSFKEFNALIEEAPRFETPLTLQIKEGKFEWPDCPIYNGLLGEIVSLIEPHSEADPVAVFMELLATFGSCVGGGPFYKIGGTYHRSNLFLALCGETSTARKGSAHDWVVEVFRHVDAVYVDKCILGGLASGEGVIHAVRDAKVKHDKSGNEVVVDEGISDKRRLFFESELAGRTFVAMKREGSTLSAVLRQAWESSTLAVATKNMDERATNAHITVIGHATLKELLSTLRPEDIAGGFANRFLFFVVRRSKQLPLQTEPDEGVMRILASRLRRSLEDARKIGRVTLSAVAEPIWKQIYNDIDSEAAERDEETVPFLSRAAPQILRISLLLALVDGSKEIMPDHLTQAAGLWDYSRKSVEFMMGGEHGDIPNDQAAMYHLLEKQGSLCVGDVQKQLKWSGAKVALVKGRLLKNRMINETVERGTGGRPRKVLSL